MENNIVQLVSSVSVVSAFLAGVCLAVTQLVKKVFITNSRYAPMVSLVTGIMLGYLFIDIPSVAIRVLIGVIIGLTASGFYSGAKTTLQP